MKETSSNDSKLLLMTLIEPTDTGMFCNKEREKEIV